MRPRPFIQLTCNRLIAGLLCLLFAAPAVSSKKPVPLPGATHRIASPNGYLVLINIDSDIEPYHKLVLKNLRTGIETGLLAYSRHVSASWSPDGDSLFVNDFAASDNSNCYVYLLKTSTTPVDINEELRKVRPQDSHLWGNHHLFIEAKKWLSNNEVLLKIHSYGDIDPDGYQACYVYSLSGTFKPAHK